MIMKLPAYIEKLKDGPHKRDLIRHYKRILRKNPWRDYRLHVTVLFLVIIAELIGTIKIPLAKDVAITIMPLIYTIILYSIILLTLRNKSCKFIDA